MNSFSDGGSDDAWFAGDAADPVEGGAIGKAPSPEDVEAESMEVIRPKRA